ncbi:MAG TPA: PQQ-binding-like beta-propeller repeat protein [Vicinamibacterales bacterium]|nr:PQQ-binding-like beta-propeller repeat protein [Vicinamibacterales bacterium]
MPAAAATRCWGLLLCVGLALPVAAQQTATSGQVVPTPQATPPAGQPTPTPTPTPPPPPPYAFGWRQSIGSSGPLTLVVTDGLLLVSGGAPPLVARSLDTGDALWNASLSPTGTPATGDHLLFVPSSGHVSALDETTGALKWSDALPSPVSAPLWRAGWLIVAGDRELRAYRGADGTRLWTLPLPAAVTNAPVIDGDSLFVSLADHSLIAVDIKKPAVTWTVQLDTAAGPLLAANGLVYFGGEDGNVYAFRQTGASRADWIYRARTGTLGAPVADAAHVYVALLNNTARALDAHNGSMRWAIELPARPSLGMALGPDKLVVPLLSGEVAVSTFRPGGQRPVTKVIAFPKPPDAPPGFFQRLESSVIKRDLARVYLATVSFQDERTLTALDSAASVKK